MKSSTTEQSLQGVMHDQACTWIARLRSDTVSEQDRQEFALWLAANPEHARAMDRMLDMWADLECLQYRAPENTPAVSRRRWLGTGLALAASVILAVIISPSLDMRPDIQQFQTRQGQQMAVELADGSTVKLNTNSMVDVRYSGRERLLTLSRGEAFFEVAHNPERPFVVTAGSTEVRALGTAFNVQLRDGLSEITVTEGIVRITELGAPTTRPAQSEVLYANQRITGDSSGFSAAESVDSARQLAWRDGKLIADEMPLSELVAELSRYHPRNIIIAEPGLAQKTVSGVFMLEDLEVILLALEQSADIRSVTLDDGSVQLIRAPL